MSGLVSSDSSNENQYWVYQWVQYWIHERVCGFETLLPICVVILDQHTTTLLNVYGKRAGSQELQGLSKSLAESLVWGGEGLFRMFETNNSDPS